MVTMHSVLITCAQRSRTSLVATNTPWSPTAPPATATWFARAEAQLSHVSSELLYATTRIGPTQRFTPSATHPPMNMPEIGTAAVLHCRFHPSGSKRDSLSWTSGIHLANQSVALTRNYTFLPGPYTSRYDYQTRSLFGEISLPVRCKRAVCCRRTIRTTQPVVFGFRIRAVSPEDSLWSGRLACSGICSGNHGLSQH